MYDRFPERKKEYMEKNLEGIELNDADLGAVQGGGLFGWIEDHVFKPAMALMRGGNPPPNVPVNPQAPFEYNPTNPGSPARH